MTAAIRREPRAAAARRYDVVVIGGGIHGVAAAFEAARRDLSVLLLERDDFGSHTSWNSLRIVHGGLRYLQTLNLRRFRHSVRERSWFLRNFPELVRPISCLMPLYGDWLRTPGIFRLAFAADAALSQGRNRGLGEDHRLARGRVLSPAETLARAPGLPGDGLRGAALWTDAHMPSSERVLIELLRWAVASGAEALNYSEAEEIRCEEGCVAGVRFRDWIGGESLEVRTDAVINAAGPEADALVHGADSAAPRFFHPSLAFNLHLDRTPPAAGLLSVAAPGGSAQTYFLHPFEGGLLAGTAHMPVTGACPRPEPSAAQIGAFLDGLNRALPGLVLDESDIIRVHAGFLPAARPGTAELEIRERVYDHRAHGGPKGLVTLGGVKFTTARHVGAIAQSPLFRVLGRMPPIPRETARPAVLVPPSAAAFLALADEDAQPLVKRIVTGESVLYMDDLLMRRTNWGIDRGEAALVTERVRALLGHETPAERTRDAGRPVAMIE